MIMVTEPEEMKAEIIARGNQDIQRLVAVLALGMCRALSQKALSTSYACHRLFGPALTSLIKQTDGGPELLEALNLASELEAVEELVPNALQTSLDDIDARLVAFLRSMAPTALESEKWLVVPPRQERDSSPDM
jgi:hypothetical protein